MPDRAAAMTADPIGEAAGLLRDGRTEVLLGPDAVAVLNRLRGAAFRPTSDGLAVSKREAHALLALHGARWVRLWGAERPEAGDELRDLAEVAFLVGGGRAEAAAEVLAGLLARLVGGDRWEMRNDLVVDLFGVWRNGGGQAVLDVAVALARTVLDRMPPDDGNVEVVRSNIGGLLATAAVATDDGPLLDDAIDLLARDGSEGSPTRLATLADALVKRHDRTRVAADVATAVERARQAVATAPADDPDPGFTLMVLGLALLAAHEHGEALATLRRAVAATDPGHREYAARWSNLGLAHSERHARTGERRDLDKALDAARRAADATADGHPDRTALLVNLGTRLLTRYDLDLDPADLTAALAAARSATETTAPGEPERRGALVALALAHERRFAAIGDPTDADHAVDLLDEALRTAEAGTDERARIRSTLSIVLRRRFEATGRVADLDRSVAEGAVAVADTPMGRSEHTRRSGQLAGTLQARFLATSGLSDAVAAIEVYTRVLDELPADHPDRFGYLVNRGLARLGLWQVAADTEALGAAVDDLQRALCSPGPAGPADRAGAWSNLCGALRLGFEHSGDPALLDEAVDAGRRAVGLVVPHHPSQPAYLINLAAALQERFRNSGSVDALDEAESVARRAVDLLPSVHPDRAEALTSLGNTLRLRFDATAHARAAAGAAVAYRHAARLSTGPVAARLRAAVGWARLETRRQAARPGPRWSRASAAYATAIDLLARLAWPGLTRTDREHLLAVQSGLAPDAAAVAVADGRPDVALSRLEAGRAVLFGQALAEHTDPPDLVRLREVARDLADRVVDNRVRVRALAVTQAPGIPDGS